MMHRTNKNDSTSNMVTRSSTGQKKLLRGPSEHHGIGNRRASNTTGLNTSPGFYVQHKWKCQGEDPSFTPSIVVTAAPVPSHNMRTTIWTRSTISSHLITRCTSRICKPDWASTGLSTRWIGVSFCHSLDPRNWQRSLRRWSRKFLLAISLLLHCANSSSLPLLSGDPLKACLTFLSFPVSRFPNLPLKRLVVVWVRVRCGETRRNRLGVQTEVWVSVRDRNKVRIWETRFERWI